jgi:hypothetical protein
LCGVRTRHGPGSESTRDQGRVVRRPTPASLVSCSLALAMRSRWVWAAVLLAQVLLSSSRRWRCPSWW